MPQIEPPDRAADRALPDAPDLPLPALHRRPRAGCETARGQWPLPNLPAARLALDGCPAGLP